METILAREIVIDGKSHKLQYVQMERDTDGHLLRLTLSGFDSERPGIRYISDTLHVSRTLEGFLEIIQQRQDISAAKGFTSR